MNEPTAFIYRPSHKQLKNKRFHVWDGTDTYCSMWSTDGIKNKNEYITSLTMPLGNVCILCVNKLEQRK